MDKKNWVIVVLVVIVLVFAVWGFSKSSVNKTTGNVINENSNKEITSADINFNAYWASSVSCSTLRDWKAEMSMSFSTSKQIQNCKLYVDNKEAGGPIYENIPSTNNYYLGDFEANKDHVAKICCNNVCKESSVNKLCEEKNYNVIAIRSFDYDKNSKKIKVFTVADSHYGANWRLIVTGKDSVGNIQFNKEIKPDISGFSTPNYCQGNCLFVYVSEEVPYIAGGTMNINLISDELQTKAVGEYAYSQFDSDISFNLVYDHYDNINEEVVYKLTNTGKRIIPFDFTHYLFGGSSCGGTSMDGGWFIMIMLDVDKNGDGIVNPGETVEARGSSHYDLPSGQTYCSKITYGFDEDRKSKEIVFTV